MFLPMLISFKKTENSINNKDKRTNSVMILLFTVSNIHDTVIKNTAENDISE